MDTERVWSVDQSQRRPDFWELDILFQGASSAANDVLDAKEMLSKYLQITYKWMT